MKTKIVQVGIWMPVNSKSKDSFSPIVGNNEVEGVVMDSRPLGA